MHKIFIILNFKTGVYSRIQSKSLGMSYVSSSNSKKIQRLSFYIIQFMTIQLLIIIIHQSVYSKLS